MNTNSNLQRIILVVMLLMLSATGSARTIGGYVDRAEQRFVNNVWNFIKEYQSTQYVGSQGWYYSQYYYAEPYMLTSSNDYYCDAVDFAFCSGHGNYYYWQTNQSTGAGVYFPNDMPTTNGLGDYNLEHLTIESCYTVASLQETSDPWSPWMRVLKGVHSIMGFHTLSYSDNGIPNRYARKLKYNGLVWQSWFDSVNEERSWWYGSFYPGMASAIFYNSTNYDRLSSPGYPDPYGWGYSGDYLYNWYQY